MNKKKYWTISVTSGIIGCLINWIILGNPPPFELPLPFLDLLWMVMHLHIHLILMALNPPSYLENFIGESAIFAQWFLIGRFSCWIIEKSRSKTKGMA